MNLDDINPIAEITKAIRLHRQLADQARADFQAALPILTKALSHNSGQSARVAAVLQSLWNGELCDNLCGLDTQIAHALVAAIATRALLAGDADSLLAPLVSQKEEPQP